MNIEAREDELLRLGTSFSFPLVQSVQKVAVTNLERQNLCVFLAFMESIHKICIFENNPCQILIEL